MFIKLVQTKSIQFKNIFNLTSIDILIQKNSLLHTEISDVYSQLIHKTDNSIII